MNLDIISYDEIDISPVKQLMDDNFDDNVFEHKPDNDTVEIYVATNPYNFVSKCEKQTIAITEWNNQTGSWIDYAFSEPNKCQPITMEGLIGTAGDVLSLLTIRFELTPSGEYFVSGQSLPSRDDYEAEKDKLTDSEIEVINENVNDDIMEIFEYDYLGESNE